MRFHRHKHDVTWANRAGAIADVERIDLKIACDATDVEAVRDDRFERYSASKENDVKTGLRQSSAEITTYRANSNNSNSHAVYCREPCWLMLARLLLDEPDEEEQDDSANGGRDQRTDETATG